MKGKSYRLDRLPQRLSRRSALGGLGAAGLAGAAALGGLACGRTRTAGQTPSSGGRTGAQATSDVPRPGGTLNDYLPLSYPLDPQKDSASGQQIAGGAMSRIFRFRTGVDPRVITDHTIEPDLGVSAESSDAITWTVKLRPDARFQKISPVNGHAVEAEDIKATFTRALDPAMGSPNRGALNMIDPNQISTVDKTTIVFKLNYPYAPFRSTLASATYSWIFPREVLSDGYDPSKTVIGSGPFILDTVQPDVAYTYRKNPDWFGRPGPYIDGLRVAVIPAAAQQLAQFTAGNLDDLNTTSSDLATAKQNNPKASVYKVAKGNSSPLCFQLGDPTSVFQDIRVRRAFSMAIDRDALGKVVYEGEAAQLVFVPAFMGKWSLPVDKLDPSTGQYYKYNAAEAKKLLEAAGQSKLQIRLASPVASQGIQDSVKVQQAINAMLNAIGIKSTIVNLDFNKDYVGSGRGVRSGYYDKDMVIYITSPRYTEADEFLFAYLHSKSTTNIEHLHDPTYNAMVDKERTLVNEDERVKAVLDIQRYIAEQMYVPSTVGPYVWELVQPRVRNYNFSDTLGLYTENHAKVWLGA